MKNNQDKEFKRWLKNKLSVTQALMIHFLITGSLSMFGLAAMSLSSNVAYGALNENGTGSTSSVAIGEGSVGNGDRSIAIGKNANTNDYESIAIGNDSKTTSNNNIAIGKGARSEGNNNSLALGNGAVATGRFGAIAIGRDTKAAGDNGIVLGKGAETTANDSMALGYQAKAENTSAVALGSNSKAAGDNAIALGSLAETTLRESVALGYKAKATGNYALAIGRESKAAGNNGIVLGSLAETTSNESMALGYRAKATANSGAAIGKYSKAGGANSIALGSEAETTKDYAIALGYRSKATGNDGALAIGRDSKVVGNNGIAIGRSAETTTNDAIALGYQAKAQYVSAVAIGKDATATGATSVALGRGSKAEGHDSYAIGFGSVSTGEKSMAFGNSSKARKINDIALGAGAETRDQGAGGYSIAIGVGAVSGSKDGVSNRNGNDSGGVAIGSGAYTGVNKNNLSSNSSVALGAGAGAGFRKLDASNMPVDNSTDVDTNVNVLKKAFGVKNVGDYQAIAGGTNGYTNVAINEATALGRNARAIGDQSVAIGAQTIAGMGSVALGGNDITQFANLKYYRSKKENFDVTETVDHDTDAEISNDTISGTYKRLVGTRLDTVYKATYAQDGSVVLGVQSHSGTPLGTAIGTNALIRKGAFGATAIGAGSQVQANAEAAVAIGMGSVANGPYAIAAGTASRAELGDVAIGYQSEASGKEGAISIGQATKAKGDSSIMIGGANVVSASNQQTSFISEKQNSEGVRDTYTKDITETINNQQVIRRYSYVTLEDKTGTIADAYATLTGTTMNIQKLDYNQNKNGHASTSVGVHSLAKGDLASAFGASSRANAIGSLALGTGAQALVQNSVAIGTGSIAGDENYQNAGYDVTKSDPVIMGTRQLSVSYDKDGKIVSDSDTEHIVYTFKWAGGENTSPGDIVSFGKKGAERQLKHVAAGRIAENSTDAVNGSQLNAIIERFVGDKIKYFSVKSVAAGNHYNDGATGTDSIAIGPDATATAINTTATGNKSKASAENSTAYGYNTEATGKSSVALGTSAIKPGTTTLVTTEASGENSTALGVASKAKGQDSIALGYGVEAKNNFATAIGSEATVTADKGIAIGKKASVTVAGGIALGSDSVASVAGAQTGISMDGAVDGARTNVYTNLRDNAKTSGANGAVSVGSPTATRQIVNLAAGTNDTDAVNVAQLKSVNLAFKGNTGTGDVRLHDQRLAVESSNTNLLTVEASDKKLTFTPKTASLSIDNATGSTTLGKVVAPTTDGLVKASELANTLNNMYWNVATSKNSDTGATHTGDSTPQPVKAGETVNFIAGEHVTIGQNGRDITISMKDALTQVQLNKAIQQTFGNGKNTTLTTDTSGMRYSLNDDISLTTVTTGGTKLSDGKVTGLNDNLTNTENKVDPGTNKSEPVKKAELPNTSTGVDKKNAATVGDVLNAGWNLQNNGEAKDFVRTYDTVNFVDGINTKAVVTTDEEGKVSKVRYNVVGLPINYTDDAGNPVTKVGDKYYKTDGAGNILDDDGNPVTKYDTTGNPLNANDTAVNPVNNVKTNLVNAKPEAGKTGTTDPTTLGNIKSGLDTIKNPDGTTTPNLANKTAGLVNLNTPNVSDNNAATVGDLKNMGWVVSAEGNSYSAQVKNANEVNFVGRNGLTVTGNTGADGVHTITIENSHSPITYTDENGNKLRKVGDNFYPENAVINKGNVYAEGSVVIDGEVYPEGTTKAADGNIVKQDGSPAVIATPIANTPSDKVKATLNSVKPNTPTTLSNVGSNLKQVVDPNGTNPGSVKNPDGTNVIENGAPVTATNKAPYTASEAADIANKSGSNAATVADVLNAGWNLQGNGKALDFVKPYDTVNFRDGGNTTITYETNGTTSNMQVNVTGLPVTNTITDPTSGKQVPLVKVGDTYYPAKADGTPNIKKDEHGNPTNGYTIADNGNIYNSGDITFSPEQKDGTKTKTKKPGANPVTINSNMSNPNITTDSKNAVNTPTQLGNVANGAKTHNPVGADGIELKQAYDGKYYPADKVNKDGSLAIDAGTGATYPPVKPIEMGNDGKWYEKDNLDSNGNPKQGVAAVPNPLKNVNKAGLVDFTNSNSNNVATVGDLRNMGWVVSSDKTTGDLETAYNDQVRNANEVKFVGTGMATVSGKTVDSIRTITVDVNAQKTVETAQVPIVYTDNDGNKLTKIGDKFYNVNNVPDNPVKHGGDLYPAGSVIINGKVYPANSRLDDTTGKVVDVAGRVVNEEAPITPVNKSDVKASMNSGDEKTNNPTVLSNVGNNLKQVVDPNGTNPGAVKNPDGTDVLENGAPVTVTNKAPYTASEAVDIVKKSGNNAATVGDVLNAGWNLQNNSEARDFVKPYDTVNFVNGGNTTAVVTTDENGTTSNVTYNVTGLPVTYTNEDGKPVSKVGNNYYVVNDKGQPLQNDGTPVTKYDANGNPLNNDGSSVTKVDTTVKPLKTNLVNPNVATDKQTTTPTQLGNVKSGLDKITGAGNKAEGLVNLNTSNVSDNNVATVGDLRNMGWVVSSDKTTGDLGKDYNDKVRNANEVKFVGTGTAIVSGKTVNGVRTITVEVNDQLSTNNSVTAVVYTKADGTKVYPKEVKNPDGTKVVKFYPNSDGTGTEIPKEDVITSVNGPDGTKNPTTLSNIASNLDGAKTGTKAQTTNAALPNTTDKAGNNYINPNNAATVGDVLNAGWNLQGNSKAVDFVKPYDTVNFINGGNTTAVVTTNAEGTTSNVTYNVTGLPVTYTNEDGKPVSKVGDNYYVVNDKGQPLQNDGTPVTKYDANGNPLNNDGSLVTKVDTTAKPLKTNLVNPNVSNTTTEPNKQTTTPTQLGNVANGAGVYNNKVDDKGNPLTEVNGKYYTTDKFENGKLKENAVATEPNAANSDKFKGLTNLTNAPDSNVATVGDIKNLGWVVSSDKTTGDLGTEYNDQVRNANEVKFVGKGTATVSGKTVDGVRTITVEVNDQVSTNNSVTAVVYTKADGTKVYPIKKENGDIEFHTTPDGKGNGDQTIPKNQVITSVNGPDGTKNPTTLSNVLGNLPKTHSDTKDLDGTTDVTPTTTQTKPDNVKNIVNNAATVGDVLNAGWNLQGNSKALDFVKPYDTVNFVDGIGTTVEAKVDEKGTTSTIKINTVMQYTDKEGNPVKKAENGKYYKESDLAGKVFDTATNTFKNENGTPLAEQPKAVNNPQVTIVNAEPDTANNKTATTTPTQLGNVANGAGVYNNKVDDKGNPLTEVNGKYYTTDKFENGKLKENAVETAPAKVVDSNKFEGLTNLTNAPDSNVATVGDIKNLGWVVSSDKTTGNLGKAYNEQVKNANEVKFVGTGTATVSGKTVDGVRTITVEVNDQVSTNNSKLPVVYTITEKNGENTSNKQVYPNKVPEIGTDGNPVKNSDGTVKMIDGFTTTPEGVTVKADGTIDPGEKAKIVDSKTTPINTSINGVEGTDKATTLSNVLGNLPQVNDKDKTVNGPDGKAYTKDGKAVTGNAKAPITAEEAADIVKKSGNNAATVGDVLNAGWNLQGNGKALDFVKPYDTVNFVDGIGTTVEAKVDEKGTTSTIKINTVMQYTDKEGNPIKKAENGKYYKESDLAGKVYDKANDKFTNADGSDLTEQPKAVKNPQVTIVNAEPDKANNKTATTTPTQLGNVANGSETYDAPEVDGEKVVQAKDGKWYKETDVVNGTANKNATAVTTPINPGKSGLVDFSKSNLTNVATVGDLQNLGWVVSSDKTTGALGTEYNDQVRNANEVKFVGKNGIQVSGKTDDKGVRTLTFEMETGEITPTEIVKPDDNKLDKKVVTIGNKVYNSEDIDTNGKPKKDAVPVGTIVDGKVYADKDLNADGKPNDSASPIAKVKENNGAKFVTGNQVADAIEKSGFIVGKNQGLRESDFENKDEKINPNDELRFADGRNTNVKLATKDVIDATGKVKTVTTVKVDVVDLPITYTDKDGKVVVKGKDGKFYYPEALDGKVYDEKEKTYKNPDGTALAKQPEAKENIQANLVNPNVSNTDTEPNKQTTTPTQLGNIANGANTFAKVEGKQIANDGKWYNEGDVLPNGKPKENATAVEKPENVGKSGLIEFEKSKPNNAATVGDLQNLGWVVSSDKTTGNTSKPYNDQVRNSNEVKFVGKNGIQVSGKTDDNGVRTLTFEMETGEITPTEIIKADGTKLVKVGNKAYNPGDIATNGQPKDGAKPVGTIAKDGNVYNVSDVDDKGNVITQTGKPAPTPIATNTPNNGTKVVTGNQVADALEKSGFVVGKNNNELSAADFKNEDEKVNPNDELRFADGKNTNVKLATKEVIDASGKVKTVTTVKVDVEELPITYTDKAGNPIVKKDGKFYLLDDKGNATNTEVKVEDIKTNLVAPNSKPNEIGTPQSLGNVASGLKATDIKTDANKSDDKEVVKALITTTEDNKKLNTVANLDDLKTLSKAGLDFGANFGKDVHKNLGEKLSILGNTEVVEKDANDEAKFSSKNVVTTTDTDKGTVNIKFSQNPDFDSIKIGNRNNRPVVTMSSEGIDAGNTKITNVAPGEISDTSQDAINGSQLNTAIKGINAGIASSVAMANLPQVSNIGMHRHNIAAAIGIHRGETAIALGLSGLNHRGSLVYKASGALNTKGHVTFGVGLGYQFDRNTRDNDTHRNDIIDLKEKLEDVIRENSEYKQEIQEYRKEQEQNKAIIEQLMKRLEALEKTK